MLAKVKSSLAGVLGEILFADASGMLPSFVEEQD